LQQTPKKGSKLGFDPFYYLNKVQIVLLNIKHRF